MNPREALRLARVTKTGQGLGDTDPLASTCLWLATGAEGETRILLALGSDSPSRGVWCGREGRDGWGPQALRAPSQLSSPTFAWASEPAVCGGQLTYSEEEPISIFTQRIALVSSEKNWKSLPRGGLVMQVRPGPLPLPSRALRSCCPTWNGPGMASPLLLGPVQSPTPGQRPLPPAQCEAQEAWR